MISSSDELGRAIHSDSSEVRVATTSQYLHPEQAVPKTPNTKLNVQRVDQLEREAG